VSDEVHPGASPDAAGSTCPFCGEAARADAVATCGTVLAIHDAAPVSPGHLLIITRRHTPDLFSMTTEEKNDALELLATLRARALRDDPAITGFTVGANCGASAGQSVMHAHIHFIPRRDSDAQRPGGTKGAVRNKLAY